MDATCEKVMEVLVRTGIAPAAIREEAHLQRDLGLDSLGLMELYIGLEDAFGIEIDQYEVRKLGTVGQLMQYLNRKGGERPLSMNPLRDPFNLNF